MSDIESRNSSPSEYVPSDNDESDDNGEPSDNDETHCKKAASRQRISELKTEVADWERAKDKKAKELEEKKALVDKQFEEMLKLITMEAFNKAEKMVAEDPRPIAEEMEVSRPRISNSKY
jgi:hypothetical protein